MSMQNEASHVVGLASTNFNDHEKLGPDTDKMMVDVSE